VTCRYFVFHTPAHARAFLRLAANGSGDVALLRADRTVYVIGGDDLEIYRLAILAGKGSILNLGTFP
jgi:hypothetical protein